MSESTPQPSASSQTSTVTPANIQQPGFTRTQGIAIGAALHGASFLFPWVITVFGRFSGVDFAKFGGTGTLLWIWPILSGATLWLAATGKAYKLAGQLAGAFPFVVVGYAYSQLHSFEFMHNLTGGGWFALVCGAILLVFSRR